MNNQTKICPYCKKPQAADSRFCANCAESLDNSAHSYLTSKRSIIIITALGTTVAFMVGVFLLATTSSKSTVDKPAAFVSNTNTTNSFPPGFSKSPEPPKSNQTTVTKNIPQSVPTAQPQTNKTVPPLSNSTVGTTQKTPYPTPAQRSVPSGASARCRDGTLSYSASRRGTCSHHGGVAEWF